MFDFNSRTPFDLNWRMFGIPFRVHPLFWLIMLLLGPLNLNEPATSLIWVAVAFVSIVIHELGHALVALAFRWRPAVFLYGFGGLTFHEAPYNAYGKRILLSFCGPIAGFALAGLAFVLQLSLEPENKYAVLALQYGFVINIFWNVLNLFPVFPLDGGQIVRTLFTWLWHGKGERASMYISIVVAIGVAGLAAWFRQLYLALLFGLMAYEGIQQLRLTRQEMSGTRYDYR